MLFENGNFGGSTTIRIRAGVGLGGAILATGTANWSTTGEKTIVFATPATVQAGSVYTIDLSDKNAGKLRKALDRGLRSLRGL